MQADEQSKQPSPTPTLILALLPLAVLVATLSSAVALFGNGATSGPSQIALLFAAGVALLIGQRRGLPWKELERALVDGIGLAMNACLILLAIGAMIGSWMLAGTAPTLIYYGLGLLDPSWFYTAALLICSIVAITIGSSWTTAGTVGLALIGVAQVLGLSPAIAAGAVISGAYFGDKLSPLSDTTNLAPAMVGTDVFTHVRHMIWTTVPSYLIALVLYTVIGLGTDVAALSDDAVHATRTALAGQFNLGWPTLLPLALLLGLALRKFPAYPAIALGALAGCVVAAFYQPDAVQRFIDPEGALPTATAVLKGCWQALANGYVAQTGDAALDSLLSRGGMSSMLNTVWLIISAMCFGAAMERTGLLQRLVTTLLRGVRGTGSLIATTVFTSIGMNIIAADQYMSIVLPGRMYRLEFARRGLAPENLSRTLEDAGTLTSPLVPWNTCGAFMAATLGVPTFTYLPYAFLNLLNPVVAIVYGILNIKLTRLPQAAAESADPTQAAPQRAPV